ncbi:MAG: DUF6494 family protein [Vulcanimicrobiaceae bacterium]
MDEDALNQTTRKFLKEVGITSQRAIETAVRDAIRDGRLTGHERIAATMTLEIEALDLRHDVRGTIALD